MTFLIFRRNWILDKAFQSYPKKGITRAIPPDSIPDVEAVSFVDTIEAEKWITSNRDRLVGSTIYTDRTCHELMLAAEIAAEYKIVRQDAGSYEAFVEKTRARGKPVVLVLDNLGDHILQTADEAVAIWKKIFSDGGLEIVRAADVLSGSVPLNGILLCDHHCRNVWNMYHAEEPFENTIAKWRCLEDIPCEE